MSLEVPVRTQWERRSFLLSYLAPTPPPTPPPGSLHMQYEEKKYSVGGKEEFGVKYDDSLKS